MSKPPERVLPDHPTHQPLERFWPYAELSEQPADDELALIHPELHRVLFGAEAKPFSMTIEFPEFEGERFTRALELARASDEFQEVPINSGARYRARFFPGEAPLRMRDLYELVAEVPDVEVLIDDRPLPYARELWLPLVWCLIK